MKKIIILFALLISVTIPAFSAEIDPCKYVDPLIGTDAHGHTFPGATTPFGMVQLSPDTRLTGWDGCSGYHYSDSVIYGFSHTHLSGTGCSDYGDILLMPFVGKAKYNNTKYSSAFSHKNEKAEPGYYSVKLKKHNIFAELTASQRCGFHRYKFPGGASKSGILLDLVHRDIVSSCGLTRINDSVFIGHRHSRAWANNQMLFFAIRFSKAPTKFEVIHDSINTPFTDTLQNLKATFFFGNTKEINMVVALSAVSEQNALLNLKAEADGINFDQARQNALKLWNAELSKITVEGKSESDKIKFYTALYHCCIQPNIYSDVTGDYRGTDLKIHKADFDYYTVFSLWDTFRAYHPLMTIINQERTNDWIKTFLAEYRYGGILPVWELSANETNCMIGYHAVSVIADAIMKNIGNFDRQECLTAMKHSANMDLLGLKEYRQFGYIPGDYEHESVSKTLEYAYDDWCISQVAAQLNQTNDYGIFSKRAQSWKNVFDPETHFMRARFNGDWYHNFVPTEINNNYTEGNSWQYSFFVPQDINTLIAMHGGKRQFADRLSEMFNTSDTLSGREQADATGLIGQYAHGNEPSHHIAYLFNYVNEPNTTQTFVRKIMYELYGTGADGLCGNEDCGQMSAWFVMSAMGIYQVCPGDNTYELGSPLFDKIAINLENGKHFIITAQNNSEKNIHIRSAKLNGKAITKSYISHSDIVGGGELELSMTSENTDFATNDTDCPASSIAGSIAITPVISSESENSFVDSLQITIYSPEKNVALYYTDDDSEPSEKNGKAFCGSISFTIDTTTTIKAIAINNGIVSPTAISNFNKYQSDKKLTLLSTFDRQYTAGGTNGLIDGIRGKANFRLGGWQGYQGQNFTAIVELDAEKTLSSISLGCLQDTRSWIIFPTEVEFFVSTDGVNYKSAGKAFPEYASDNYTSTTKDFKINCSKKAKFVKISAKNFGTLPEWHLGHGGQAYIFVDEIIIK